MISWLYVHVKRNRSTCGTLAAALVCRLLQMTVLGRPSHAADSLFDSYLSMNAVDFATFLFIPLFCVGQMRSLKLYSSPQCALALGSRSRVALRICADCVLTGLLMSVLLQVTSLIVLFWRFGTIPMWEALRPVDLVLQGVVLANAGMVSFLAMLAFHSSAFSCLTGILYGMWDFMAMNVVGGGLPPIGWSLAIVPDGAGWAAIVVQAGALVSLSLVLGVLLWLAAGKVDYLDCGRGLSKA